jgi:hypothetical protein
VSGSTSSAHGQSGDFELFWDAYPKKEGRLQAMAQFRSAVAGGVSPSLLIAKAKQYAIAKARISDPLYLKMPSNWLRDELWLEDPQPPKPRKPSKPMAERGRPAAKAAKKPKPKKVARANPRGRKATAADRREAQLARRRRAEEVLEREAEQARQRNELARQRAAESKRQAEEAARLEAELAPQREAERVRHEAEVARQREAELARQEAELARQREDILVDRILRILDEEDAMDADLRHILIETEGLGLTEELKRSLKPKTLRMLFGGEGKLDPVREWEKAVGATVFTRTTGDPPKAGTIHESG